MDFDYDINRYQTNSLKYDFKEDKGKPKDIFPMWVADMDFKCCDAIIEAITKIWLDSGEIFGKSGLGFQRMNIALPRTKLKML